jgi:hypothetical protein
MRSCTRSERLHGFVPGRAENYLRPTGRQQAMHVPCTGFPHVVGGAAGATRLRRRKPAPARSRRSRESRNDAAEAEAGDRGAPRATSLGVRGGAAPRMEADGAWRAGRRYFRIETP